jgi:murein DD-endopeptidase MepM/ murein hydrolase activator NlpD
MRTDRYLPDGPPYLLYGLLGASLLLNVVMVFKLDSSSPEPVDAVVEMVETVEGEDAVASDVAAPPVVAPVAVQGDWQVMHASVNHSLARTFSKAAGDDGDALSAVASRVLVWDLDLRRDVQKGDEIWVAWRPVEGEEPEVAAVWYRSSKLGETLKAYRYQAPTDAHASYWAPDGSEAAMRLVGGPIEGYDQITSLLKDRPTHQGMDFRAPVGTPVMSPKAGTVTRTNWNTGANGYCAEVRFADGTLAKFLHLDEVEVKPGQYVKSGQVIASSGNTGHSTAPHLHYQLDHGSKNVDPLEYHDTLRRRVDANGQAGLDLVVAEYDALFAQEVASR